VHEASTSGGRKSGPADVTSVESVEAGRAVYNVEVAREHTYRVSTSRVWAHNECPEGGARGGLNKSHQSAIRKIDNAVHDHMTPGDLSGAVADQMGSPIPKPGGGFWDHAKEMGDTLRGLRSNASKLRGVADPAAEAARHKAVDAVKTAEDAVKGAGI